MTDIPLNTYIEWTDEDRKRGFCPVPAGSVVTVWFKTGDIKRDNQPEEWSWEDGPMPITGYLVHQFAREPIVRWIVVKDDSRDFGTWFRRESAENWAKEYGGRVVKLVEERE